MKPILFIDFDGTICHERYWRSLPPDLHGKLQVFLFGEDLSVFNDWMRGKYTAEEVNKMVAEKLNVPFEYLWKIFVEDARTMNVSWKTLDKISALRDKFTVILITGNMDSFTRFTAPSLQLENYFDHISNSFYEKRHKNDNDGMLFTVYAEKFNSPLGKAFLIDDSDSTCRIFGLLGGTTYQVGKGKNNIDHYLDLLK